MRILLLSPEPIRQVMAGVGIRFLELARVLSQGHAVVLGAPAGSYDDREREGIAVERYDGGRLPELVRGSDVVLLHGHVSNLYFTQPVRRPLVVDLYDPFPIENLNYFPTLGNGTYRHDRATLEAQLREGDLFLCSSDEQRLFYLGMLFALGRLGPEAYFEDYRLANLVRIVPFGASMPPEKPGDPVLRGVIPGIGADDPILFFGGIYDWYDPMLLLGVLPSLLERHPRLRVIFSSNPNPDSTPQGTFEQVVAESRARGWTGRHVFFVPWVAAENRWDLYRESTVAVVLHQPRFETELSMRTRVLDYLAAGLPVVASAGGAMSRVLLEEGLGTVIAPGDGSALREAIDRLLRDRDARARCSETTRSWARRNSWSHVVEPLREFLASPRVDPHKHRYGPGATASDPLWRRCARRLRRLFRAR